MEKHNLQKDLHQIEDRAKLTSALYDILSTPSHSATEKPKYFYHGTIDKFIPEIISEGLTPHPENTWNGTMETMFGGTYNPAKDDEAGFVYLAPEENWAWRYAKGKANYFRALPGTVFTVGKLKMVKAPDAPVIPDAVATVLRIKAAESLVLEQDPHDWAATRVHGAVPPELIDGTVPEPAHIMKEHKEHTLYAQLV